MLTSILRLTYVFLIINFKIPFNRFSIPLHLISFSKSLSDPSIPSAHFGKSSLVPWTFQYINFFGQNQLLWLNYWVLCFMATHITFKEELQYINLTLVLVRKKVPWDAYIKMGELEEVSQKLPSLFTVSCWFLSDLLSLGGFPIVRA